MPKNCANPTCGPLGWTVTRGISRCELCAETVPPSGEDGLAEDMVGPYRFAADLMSRRGDVGSAATSRLPEAIQSFSRSALCDVMIRAGIVLGMRRSGHALADVLTKPAAEIAAVVVAGGRLIAGWPRSAKDEVRDRIDGMGRDLIGYDRLRIDLRWIGRGSEEGARLAALAFPTLEGRTAKPFAGEKRYYTATQTNTKLWINSSELKLLREAEAVGFEELPSNRRLRARYDADDVDGLRAALDEGIGPGSAASELDVPTYALGQFVRAGRLNICKAPGVHVLRGVPISKRSIQALIAKLRCDGGDIAPPEEWIPMRRLLTSYPGEKPWGECVELLFDGRVKFHVGTGPFSVRNIRVDPTDLPMLRVVGTGVERDPTAISRLPLREAYEVLGAPDEEAMVALRSAKVEILVDGRGKSVGRSELHGLVGEIAFASEVVTLGGASSIAIFHQLSRLKVPHVHGAWSRADLVMRGMVKPASAADGGQRGSTSRPG